MRDLPRHIRVLLPIALINLVLLEAARLAFWLAFRGWFPALPPPTLLTAFHIGLKFDVRLILLTLLPVAALAWIPGLRLVGDTLGRRLWSTYLVVALLLTSLTYAFDFGHFAYLRARLDARALGFLANPLISLQMIWESYHVVWAVAGLIALVAGYAWLIRALLRWESSRPRERGPRWRRALVMTILVIAWIGGMWAKLQWYPLRWSDAFFSTDEWSGSLALNPVLYLADTAKNSAKGYDETAVRAAYPIVARYLGIDRPLPEPWSLRREVLPPVPTGARPNVVVIFLESFAHYKCGIFGNPLDPSPNLDALAREGVFFPHFYTPMFGTARSVFALITGIPDVETHETATRNPLIVRQHTIVNAFAGYEKLYFLGGSVNWGNIRGVLAHNIAGLRIFEEGSYRSPRVDAWGIDDLHMFEEANEALRALGDRPFFAVLQTSGNHRPYTIPDDNRGFRRIHHAQAELASAGFTSNDELDSFRFVDHSLGYFFSAARKERYFANTIFVMFGDHGYLGRAKSLTQAELDSGILRFHVPLIIVGPPSTCSPRVVDKVASEVDVLPTVASLAGVPYTNTTLGRDLFDPRFDQARYAFVMADHYNQPRIGIVSDNLFVRQSPDGSEQEIWDLAAGVARPQPDAATQAKAHEMAELSRGLYESARYLLYHNSAAAAGGGGTPSEAPTPK